MPTSIVLLVAPATNSLSLSAADFQPNNEDVSHSFLIGVRFVRDRARTSLKQYDGKIVTGIIRKQNVVHQIEPQQKKEKNNITTFSEETKAKRISIYRTNIIKSQIISLNQIKYVKYVV